LYTLIEALLKHAEQDTAGSGLRYLHDGELNGKITHWSWSELATRAISLAKHLVDIGVCRGDRALLMYPDGLDFAQAFLGCMFAGVIPVPVSAQDLHPQRGGKLLAGIKRVCTPTVALTTAALARRAAPLVAQYGGNLTIVETDTIALRQAGWSENLPKPAELAFLQFTSGSTSVPKGVMITHCNIAEHQRIVAKTHRIHGQTHLISWLPTHHDMGLAGDLMMAVWSGRPLTMMAPHHFVERPMRWLEAISGQPSARSGGPNFAFALVTRKLDRNALEGLDLSTWETAHCGAEPIRRSVLQIFAEAVAPAGFHPSAFSLCYGLAEATLYVSDVRPWPNGFAPGLGELDGFTASGKTNGDVEIAIVDMEGTRSADGVEGEIWVRGQNVAIGYWEAPEATEATFGARLRGDDGEKWMRTGDLGRVVDGILYPTGRIKDLIIWRGQNIYPQDVEHITEAAHPALRPGCSAAFAVEADNETESVGIVAEVRADVAENGESLDEIVECIRRAIGTEFGIPVAEVSLIAPRGLLKTTSGKVMRAANRTALEKGTHRVLRSSRWKVHLPSGNEIESVLRSWVAKASGIAADRFSSDTSLRELGIDSVRIVELRDHLQTQFQSTFQMKQLGESPTMETISLLMRGVPSNSSSRAIPEPSPEMRVSADAQAVVLPNLNWRRKS
jgi:acyl-CoA synthetase (AMP-forming)/AMP-acid ligase II/acyl carrier protein